MGWLGGLGSYYIAIRVNIPVPYDHGPYFVSGEDAKAYIADFVRSPIASTFMLGSMFIAL